jgi:FkbM family methyltransferase
MNHALPLHAIFRPGTVDRDIWYESVVANGYGLPVFFAPGDWVLDVGAHTGSVSWRCCNSGARVVAVEPGRENYTLLLANLDPFKDRVIPVNVAAWRSDQPATLLRFDPNWMPANTGGGCVLGDAGGVGHEVLAIPLDDLLKLRPQWRLLKLDCECSEFPILYTSACLGRVWEIAGEYHERPSNVIDYAECGKPFTMMALAEHLHGQGFTVTVAAKAPGMGLFWAKRG